MLWSKGRTGVSGGVPSGADTSRPRLGPIYADTEHQALQWLYGSEKKRQWAHTQHAHVT